MAFSQSLRLLHGIAGVAGKANDVLFHRCVSSTDCRQNSPTCDSDVNRRVFSHSPPFSVAATCSGGSSDCNDVLVFFGGDVQNVRKKMEYHWDSRRWINYSLEDTARHLSQRFPDRHIFIVIASVVHLGTFAVYRHFVDSNNFGVPSHSSDSATCVTHLRLLLQNAAQAVGLTLSDATRITIVGFSKGCVVLNQLLHELEVAWKEEKNRDFLSNIDQLYFLDGGHSGTEGSWVTDERLIEKMASLLPKLTVKVRVTPYQIADTERMWKQIEEAMFWKSVTNFAIPADRRVYFESEPRTLDNHFRLLEVFDP